MIPVILSGGSGTRLWPHSRKYFPKQFLAFVSEQTLFQDTLQRLDGLTMEAPLVICNEAHRFIVAEQLRQTSHHAQSILLEPVGRNTAPAVALAALQATAQDPDSILLVLPADHVIQNVAAFHQALAIARQQAEAGKLVTFGIVPTAPETGFGYIEAGKTLTPTPLPLSGRGAKDTASSSSPSTAQRERGPGGEGLSYPVHRFVEKPDRATAAEYLASGEYYWNSGMFMFKASRYLEELARFRPDILDACRKSLVDAKTDMDFVRVNEAAFTACPADSIDYAVMEKTGSAVVVPLDAGWNDVGSWSAIWEVSSKDASGNRCHGDIMTEDTQNSLLFSESRLLATVGIKDMVVIETRDAVLVAHKDRVQDVKAIVQRLEAEGRSEKDWHRIVYRPWGCYDSVDSGERFQAKRITVKPGATLSLQKHHHRAEHWVVVSGTAEVTCDDRVFLLTENQSTYIPLGSTHRLSNPGKMPLEIIEVQSGSYLGEDDIVRFDDQYGRTAQ